MTTPPTPDNCSTFPARYPTLALFLISVLGLFIELMLIRWVSTEIRIFAYLQNTILVVCFLGLGMGCWTCRQSVNLRQMTIPLAILILCLSVPWLRSGFSQISSMFALFQDFLIWDPGYGARSSALAGFALALVLSLLLLLMLWEIFVPVGRLLGRLMDDHPRIIQAYSVNIAGSLAGIGLFVALSALYASPWVWCLCSCLLLLPFWKPGQWRDLGLMAIVVAGSFLVNVQPYAGTRAMQEPGGQTNITSELLVWSPYQKLNLLRIETPEEGNAGPENLLLMVNNTPYLKLLDLSDKNVARWPKAFPEEQRGLSQYDIPLLVKPEPGRMLVVGSGGGNDVAGGVRHGAKHIVAVEIDPAILRIGREYHPEKPYSAGQVTAVNDDARAYFARAGEKFDLIIFGLLDSHTTTAMTNARLDHFVYTQESIRQAKQLLNEGGVMCLSFEVQKAYIADRINKVLHEEFQQKPICFRIPNNNYGYGGVMFIVGDLAGVQRRIQEQSRLKNIIEKWQKEFPVELPGVAPVTTDDWPYLYLEQPTIPTLFFVLGILMAVLFLVTMRRLNVKTPFQGWNTTHWHFFFLGAAFMLLETQNISKAAVALGSTWDVNAVIITAILMMILLANLVASLLPRLPQLAVYVALVGSCLVLYFVDLSWFVSWPYTPRAITVGALTCLPILFSGIIFIRSFAAAQGKDSALGANLLGSLVGGLLQCVTYLIGIKALLLIVAVLYAIAFITRPRSVRTGSLPPSS